MSPEPHIQTSASEDVSTEGQSSVVPERCERSAEHVFPPHWRILYANGTHLLPFSSFASTHSHTMLHAKFVTQRVRVPQEIYASKDKTFAPRVISVFGLHGAAGISLAAILRG